MRVAVTVPGLVVVAALLWLVSTHDGARDTGGVAAAVAAGANLGVSLRLVE